jgi:hypothetical protein
MMRRRCLQQTLYAERRHTAAVLLVIAAHWALLQERCSPACVVQAFVEHSAVQHQWRHVTHSSGGFATAKSTRYTGRFFRRKYVRTAPTISTLQPMIVTCAEKCS